MEDQETRQEREGGRGREEKKTPGVHGCSVLGGREGGRQGPWFHSTTQTHASSCQPAGKVSTAAEALQS